MSDVEKMKEARETFEKAKVRYRACQNQAAMIVQTAFDQVAAYGALLDEAGSSQRYRDAMVACDLMAAVVAVAGARLSKLEAAAIPAETLIEAAKRARPEQKGEE